MAAFDERLGRQVLEVDPGGLATRLFDPLITAIASDFETSVGVAALLSNSLENGN